MPSPNVYDVTTFTSPTGTSPYTDVGKVMNEIIANIKANQTTQTTRPGAVIYIPPGHYPLFTTVEIDISFLQIKGSGHGFLSQETRDYDTSYTPATWQETIPGGTHIICKFSPQGAQSAFHVNRTGNFRQVGRINAVEFYDFMIDGADVNSRPHTAGPSYKIGIAVDSAADALIFSGMGFTDLFAGVIMHSADGTLITNSRFTELGNCILLYDYSTSVKISNNYLLSDWTGYSVYASNGDNLMVTNNNISYGASVYLTACTYASVIGNHMVSGWPHMIYMDVTNDSVIADNHIRRPDNNQFSNGNDDTQGIVYSNGARNSITGNRITVELTAANVRLPAGGILNAIWIDGGDAFVFGNRITCATGLNPMLHVTPGAANARIIYSATTAQNGNQSSSTVFVATP